MTTGTPVPHPEDCEVFPTEGRSFLNQPSSFSPFIFPRSVSHMRAGRGFLCRLSAVRRAFPRRKTDMPYTTFPRPAAEQRDMPNARGALLSEDQAPLPHADRAVRKIICGAMRSAFSASPRPRIPLRTPEKMKKLINHLANACNFKIEMLYYSKIKSRRSACLNSGIE